MLSPNTGKRIRKKSALRHFSRNGKNVWRNIRYSEEVVRGFSVEKLFLERRSPSYHACNCF